LSAVFVDDANTARTRVKLYQTGKHHKEFMAAVEKSRDKVQSLIPDESVNVEELKEAQDTVQPVSTRRRELESILHKHARKDALDLQVLEQECLKAGIPWDWTVQQLEVLIRTGHLIAPKPWQVQLVTDEISSGASQTRKVSVTKLAQLLGNYLRESKASLSQATLANRLEEEGVSSAGIEEGLNLLRNQGYVLKTSSGTYRWTGD
jgi:hypothetical protein